MPGPIAAAFAADLLRRRAATIPAARPRQPQCSIATPSLADKRDRQAVGDLDERGQ